MIGTYDGNLWLELMIGTYDRYLVRLYCSCWLSHLILYLVVICFETNNLRSFLRRVRFLQPFLIRVVKRTLRWNKKYSSLLQTREYLITWVVKILYTVLECILLDIWGNLFIGNPKSLRLSYKWVVKVLCCRALVSINISISSIDVDDEPVFSLLIISPGG